MNGFLLTTVLTFLALMLGVQFWAGRQARKAVGQPVPESPLSIDPSKPALVYFFSPTCGPCRQMAPGVDALIREGRAIHKVDVMSAPEIAMAWKVMATPTTFAVRDGRVTEVAMGFQAPARLQGLLGG